MTNDNDRYGQKSAAKTTMVATARPRTREKKKTTTTQNKKEKPQVKTTKVSRDD